MNQVPHANNEIIDMEHVADSALDEIEAGQIVSGEIVTIDNEFVYVNVGSKSDGRIPIEEFKDKPEVGDVVDVLLKNKRLVDGMYQLSKTAAEYEKVWKDFIQKYYIDHINLIEDTELLKDCKMLFKEGTVTEKMQVLTLLSFIKQFLNSK